MANNQLEYRDFEWATEDGGRYTLRDLSKLRPVIDMENGRLYAVTEIGSLVLMQDYGVTSRRSARDAAIYFWGDPSGWRDLEDKPVSCQCCASPAIDLSSFWRVSVIDTGLIKAKHEDTGKGVLGEHTMYESPFLDPESRPVTRANSIATFAVMVELFGEIFDMSNGTINPPYTDIYRQV